MTHAQRLQTYQNKPWLGNKETRPEIKYQNLINYHGYLLLDFGLTLGFQGG